MSFPLDPAPQDMQAMGEAAVSYLIGFIQGLDDAPAEATEGALDLANRLRAVPPEHGGEFAPVFAEAQEAISRTFEYAGPGYLAYIPGGGLYTAALAEFIAQGVNRYVGLWQPSPAVVQIEENVTRWLCDLFDYPEGSQGLLLSGGSMANLSAMVTARHAKLGEDFTDGVYYVSEQAHASVPKAATIAGFSKRNVRIVADRRRAADGSARRCGRRSRADRADGLRPFLVAPSVGTTNTGAIDPIADIADIAEAEDLWLHVDGAYGGFFQLTDRGRERFRGIERSDSVTLDPHKGLFLPYGTGGSSCGTGPPCATPTTRAPPTSRICRPTGELPNYSEHSAELSRDWRGLRVWMPLALHGVAAFREALDEKLDLAGYLADAFRDDDRIELSLGAAAHRDPVPAGGRRRRHAARVPGTHQRLEAGVPVEHDDRRRATCCGCAS